MRKVLLYFMLSLLPLALFAQTQGLQPQAQPQAPQVQAPEAPQVQPPQLPAEAGAALEKLTPEQRKAVEEVTKEKGLTKEAIEILKTRPEFKGLSPEEVLKGKEMLEKKEEKKEISLPEKVTIGAEREVGSLFDRYRLTGEYQKIETKLKPFGYEFFKEAAVKVITERKDLPVPAKYIIGPGDEVRILFWGRVNAQYNLTVDRDGKITIPQVGPVTVAGMTFEDMSKKLIELSEQMVGANIDVTLGSLKTIPIFVLGDVRRPGAYMIGSFATITDALLLAGGPNEIGSMRKIELRRKDKVFTTLDLYDLFLKGDKSKDVILQAGDIVFVPPCGPLVGIAGNVKRPAVYELKDRFDLSHLIEMAGGLIPTGYTQQIQVERVIKHERQIVLDVDARDPGRIKSFLLQDGDLVKVFNIVDLRTNVVYLYGNVKRPGQYEWKEGMRLKDIVASIEDLLPETYLEYGLIKRVSLPEMKTELVPFVPKKLLLEADERSNLYLRPLDSVYLFSKWMFEDRPVCYVEGEVRKYVELLKKQKEEAENRLRSEIDSIRRAREELKKAYVKQKEKAPLEEEMKRLEGREKELLQEMNKPVKFERPKPLEITIEEGAKLYDILLLAGGLTKDAYLDEVEIFRIDPDTKDRRLLKVNLKKVLEKDPEHNLRVLHGDIVRIHSYVEYKPQRTVFIEGEVSNPGSYIWTEGMTVKDLIFSAGNILDSAFLEEAEISSQVLVDGKLARIEHRTVNLEKALKGDPDENVGLKPYDRLFVKRIPDFGVDRYVTILGEVPFPGRYKIRRGERLSSLIERAGGYKETAYLRGAVFTRKSVKELQKKALEEMITRLEREILQEAGMRVAASLSAEEVEAKKVEIQQRQKFIESLKKIEPLGRMTIKISHLRLLKGSEFDIELEDGDSLFIPPKNPVVNVVGAVYSQGSFLYREGFDYRDYVSLAGGPSRYADTKNIFVLKADGSAKKIGSSLLTWNFLKSRWEISSFSGEEKEIEPGDTIVVPEKVERIAWLRNIKDITQILMNTAVVAGTVKYLFE